VLTRSGSEASSSKLKAQNSSRSGSTSVVGKNSTPNSSDSQACASAILCVQGIDWQAKLKEETQQLSVAVIFDDDVWAALKAGTGAAQNLSFRDSVSFELADRELRVAHAGASVLELRLSRQVNPSSAVAKLCSRRRRVAVTASLVAPSSST